MLPMRTYWLLLIVYVTVQFFLVFFFFVIVSKRNNMVPVVLDDIQSFPCGLKLSNNTLGVCNVGQSWSMVPQLLTFYTKLRANITLLKQSR